MNNVTSNAFYGGLNRRFEKRAALLRRFGFTYARVEVPERGPFKGSCVGLFVRSRHRQQVITAAEVMHACGRAWRDALVTNLYRAA
jgi:hypothetical protein